MPTVNIFEAKTQLSRLIGMVERGEEVVIARAGKPVAKLTRLACSCDNLLLARSFIPNGLESSAARDVDGVVALQREG